VTTAALLLLSIPSAAIAFLTGDATQLVL